MSQIEVSCFANSLQKHLKIKLFFQKDLQIIFLSDKI